MCGCTHLSPFSVTHALCIENTNCEKAKQNKVSIEKNISELILDMNGLIKIIKNREYDLEIKGQNSFVLDVSRYLTFCEINCSAAINLILACLEPGLYLHAPPSALSDCFISVGWSRSAQRNHKCYSAQVLTEHKILSFFFPAAPHRHHYVNHCHRGAHHRQHHYLKSFCPMLL